MVTLTITPAPELRLRADSHSILPLTTIFTPPSSCLNAPYTLIGSNTGEAGFSTAFWDRNELSSQCYPSSFSSLQWSWSFYSPGVCPSGWSIGQTRTIGEKTQAWCCPSSMSVTQNVTTGVRYEYCTSLASNEPVIYYKGSRLGTTSINDFTFFAEQWPLSIEWASSDLSLLTPASAPLLGLTTATGVVSLASDAALGSAAGAGSAGSRSSSSHANGAPVTDDGLSTGAKAGIGVGAGVAVVALIAALVFWIFKRRSTRKRIPEEAPKAEYSDFGGKAELSSEGAAVRRPEPSVELAAINTSPQEIDAQSNQIKRGFRKKKQSPVELEGNWYGHEAGSEAKYR